MAKQRFVALLLGAALMSAPAANAQDLSEGDQVYAARDADLKVEAEVVASARKNDLLSVRDVSGKWLWVETASGERGWIDRQFVTRTAPAPDVTPVPTSNSTSSARAAGGGAIASPDPASAANDVQGNLLLAVGALSGQNVYITYAYIGTVADGYANQVYTPEQVQELMKEVTGLCAVAGQYMRTLTDAEISEDDRQTVEQMVAILELLRTEANALSAFVESESQEDLQAYEAARAQAWPRIQTALRIQ